jgi:hypothetical protein
LGGQTGSAWVCSPSSATAALARSADRQRREDRHGCVGGDGWRIEIVRPEGGCRIGWEVVGLRILFQPMAQEALRRHQHDVVAIAEEGAVERAGADAAT